MRKEIEYSEDDMSDMSSPLTIDDVVEELSIPTHHADGGSTPRVGALNCYDHNGRHHRIADNSIVVGDAVFCGECNKHSYVEYITDDA